MSLERLRTARKRSIGTKQTAKAIEKGNAQLVFVARDAEEQVTKAVVQTAQEHGLEVILVDSMVALGRACGIEVGAATAAILNV
jgi:large subunit ribosomal protein L7A